jgi:hypothetical protein
MYGDSFLQEISAVERIREKTNCYRFPILVFSCSNKSVLLASRYRSIFITIKTILKAFILEMGMIIAVPDPDSKKKRFFVRIQRYLHCQFFIKKGRKKSRSLTGTGSGFEKESYGSKPWLLYVGGFQNKPVFQRKNFYLF